MSMVNTQIWEAVKNMNNMDLIGEEKPYYHTATEPTLYFKRKAILNARYQIRNLFGDMSWVRVNKERTKIIEGPF
jgi:hypothetical protein